MPAAQSFLQSTIGKKVVMAVTGLVMVGFVVAHVTGNLLVFRGAEAMNEYSAFLHSLGGLLWVARGVLLVSVLLHFWAAMALTNKNAAARPVAYAQKAPQVSTVASRTMLYGGLLLGAFIVIHVLHLTTGHLLPQHFDPVDVYGNVVRSFQMPVVAGVYIVAMVALGLHIFHGAWSSFRTLGLSKPSPDPLKKRLSLLLALALWVGFTAIPVAVLVGVVK